MPGQIAQASVALQVLRGPAGERVGRSGSVRRRPRKRLRPKEQTSAVLPASGARSVEQGAQQDKTALVTI
jgi:hypothetical protein